MKIKLFGIVSIETGRTTVVTCLGTIPQNYPIPDGFKVEIAPALTEKGFQINDQFIIFPGKSSVLMTSSPHFNRLEVIPLENEDAQAFFLTLQGDPDVKEFLKVASQTYQKEVDGFLSDAIKVVDALPASGQTAKIAKQLDNMDLGAAWKEIIAAIKVALPEKWEKYSKMISTEGKTFLSK